MKLSGLGRLRSDQHGFTAVELIVTMAISSLVMTSIFPLFSLTSSVYRTWQGNAESRAVGQAAAVILARDLRDDAVARMTTNVLVLQTAPNPSTSAQPGNQNGLCIRYTIDSTSVGGATLRRQVTDYQGKGPNPTVVAHGVHQFTPSMVPSKLPNATIQVTLQLDTVPPTQAAGQVSVPLWFSTRVPPSTWPLPFQCQ